MTRRIQKHEELLLVEQMRRGLGGVPQGQLDPCDSPDVCVTSNGRRIGIEVTELHQASLEGHAPRRLQESERAGIVALAGSLAVAASMPAVDVAVHFNDSVPVGKSDRERIANQLVKLVSTNLPNEESAVTVDVWRQRGSAFPWIRTVRIFRAGLLTKHHWAVPDSGWVQMDFVSELQSVIDDKNRRYSRYIAQCDECWLLVVASGGRPSGLFEPSEATRNHVYRSVFARTLFLEAFTGVVVGLTTKAA